MITQEIVDKIIEFASEQDAVISKWYVGIAHDIKQRLFVDHKVNEVSDKWIYCPSDSAEIAFEAEKRLLNKGFDGGPGGSENPKFVYSYLKNDYTIQ